MRELTNNTEVVVEQLAYDPYGRVLVLVGANSSVFQYAGYYNHSRSGLNLTVYRAYSPATGRWLSRDPVDQGVNLYAYVENDPINEVDPLGWFAERPRPPRPPRNPRKGCPLDTEDFDKCLDCCKENADNQVKWLIGLGSTAERAREAVEAERLRCIFNCIAGRPCRTWSPPKPPNPAPENPPPSLGVGGAPPPPPNNPPPKKPD